ncbi:hypothetical protein QO009_003087 [Brevibacillus aydinogluensis]|uniref:hypothetical protein n=1 Tax=Brevibacillus aydinogluensis TaxID=927786 RepID=UPI0028931B6E|nr:hypothetical protein [Brevibacillus aydinogluensis]MDT3417192.1 hypothetical protein [Brevibacillus aydinogluensis]
MHQGIVDIVWIKNEKHVVSWLLDDRNQRIWESINKSQHEDQRTDLYDSLLFLLQEAVQKDIDRLTILTRDRVLLKHLSGVWIPKKSLYVKRFEQVLSWYSHFSQLSFEPLNRNQNELGDIVQQQYMNRDRDELNDPDLAMISFI